MGNQMSETCPHCGAPYDGVVENAFVCGSYPGFQSNRCEQAELEKLREENEALKARIAAAKEAEPLVWEDNEARGLSELYEIVDDDNNWWYVLVDGKTEEQDFGTKEAAKAHAEELHQQAYREIQEKWGKRV